MSINQKKIINCLKYFILTIFAVPILLYVSLELYVYIAYWVKYWGDDGKAYEIQYSQECGQAPPLLVKIPVLSEGQNFSCNFKVKKGASYEVALQYPYANNTERQEIWDMHRGRGYKDKYGTFIDASVGSISFSITQDEKKYSKEII